MSRTCPQGKVHKGLSVIMVGERIPLQGGSVRMMQLYPNAPDESCRHKIRTHMTYKPSLSTNNDL